MIMLPVDGKRVPYACHSGAGYFVRCPAVDRRPPRRHLTASRRPGVLALGYPPSVGSSGSSSDHGLKRRSSIEKDVSTRL